MLLAAAVRGAADAAGSAVKLNSSFGSCPLQWSPFTPSPAASFISSTDVSRGAAWCSLGTHTGTGGGHTGLDGPERPAAGFLFPGELGLRKDLKCAGKALLLPAAEESWMVAGLHRSCDV